MKRTLQLTGAILLPIAILFSVGLLNWESISYYTLRKVAQLYAGRVDIALDIGSISGKPFSETIFENVSLRPEKGEPQAYHFKAQSISCTYNLWDLKKSAELFSQGLHCSARTPEFVQDFSVSMTEDEAESERNTFLLPAELPGLDVHNGSITLANTGWEVAIHKINGQLLSSAAIHELRLNAETFRFRHQGEAKIETGFASLLRYTDKKLSVESFESGEEIRATGFIDLAQVEKGFAGFATEIAFAESRLKIEGSVENYLVKALVSSDNFDIAELQKRLGASGWDVSGKIRGKAELAYNLESKEDLNGSFAFDIKEGQFHGVDIEAVTLSGSVDNEILNLLSVEARTTGNHILLSDVSVPMPLLAEGEMLAIIGGTRAKFGLDITDFQALLRFFKAEEDVLPDSVRPDSLTIYGYLEKGSLHLEDGRAETSDSNLLIKEATIPIPASAETFGSVPLDLKAEFQSSNVQGLAGLFGDIQVAGNVAANISIEGNVKEPRGVVSLSGDNLSFEELQIGSLVMQGEVQLIQETLGKLQSAQFTVTELTQTNASGTFALPAPVTASWQQDRSSMSAAFQIDRQGEVAILIGTTPENEIAGKIITRNLDSIGWLGNFIENRYFFHGADIEAVFTGLPGNFKFQLTGVVREAGARDVPFPLSGSFSLQYSSKGIEISKFTWKSLERNQLTLSGYLPYDPMASEPFLDGELALEGHVDFPALEDVAVFLEPWVIGKGSVDLDMDVTGSWDQPRGHILLKVEGLHPPDTLKQYMDSATDITCDIVAEDDAIFLKTANINSISYTARAAGSWQHGFSLKELLQKRTAELTGELAVDASLKLKDLNFLRKNLPWLRRFEGDMQGELHIAGQVTKPSINGSFSLKEGEASHTLNFPMVSGINLQGNFDEHSITIQEMQAEVGGSPVNLTGNIIKDNEAVTVNLHADGNNVLLFRNNDIRMRGDIQLDVSGPLESLAIKGTTGLTGGYYTGNIDFLSRVGSSSAPVSEGAGFLFSFPDPPLKNAVLDIKITTIEPFRIRNNLIRGILRPELSLQGTGELPFLIGTVYIDPSRVLLPSGRLQIQSGLLRFLAGEPDRPQLDLVAQSKVLGYDINVITRGPLDDPIITLSSSPALPNDDLMLLLLTGQAPRDDVASGTRSTASTNVMLYLGRDFLTRWLEDESGASDESILDRFELDYGRGVTKSGEQTVEGNFRLSEYTTREGKLYYLSAEKDKYDAYNYGLKLVFRFE